MNRRTLVSGALAIILSLSIVGNVSAAGLTVRYVSGPSVAHRNQTVTLTVATTKSSLCTIAVKYSTGVSKAAGLVRKKVPVSGKVSWTWKVGANTKHGKYPVTVSCSLGSKTGTLTRYLTVK